MQLGKPPTCRICTHRTQTTVPVPALPRSSAPPTIATQRRAALVAHAKRSSKRSQNPEGSDPGDQEATASAWDAALANIPTEDEAEGPADSSVDSDLTVAATAERTASQGPDAAASTPSTSYAPDVPATPGGSSGAPSGKKPRSTVLSLAEYNLLMDAMAAKEKEVAAQREKAAREAAGGTALAVPEVSPLDAGRQGFQAFALDGGDLELLVAETTDGRLLLSDCYVAAKAPGSEGAGGGAAAAPQYSRPTLEGEMPEDPLLFQVIPWVERGGSDMFKRKPATNKVKKVYFIGLEPSDEEGMDNPVFDLDQVFCFDGKSKVLARSEVRVVGSLPLVEPVLRVRPTGLTLEEAYLLPDPIEVAMATATDLADMSEEELEERLAELEKAAEALDELDEMPDVPSVDMM